MDFEDFVTINITLYINKLDEIDDGILYRLNIEPVLYYDEQRMILEYFYVQKEKIYKIIAEDIDINELKTKKDIITHSFIVCQDEEIKGLHRYMLVNDGIREYHYYNTAVETGYYEQFVWEYGKGLISYKSGWGAESRPIELQILDG